MTLKYVVEEIAKVDYMKIILYHARKSSAYS